MKKLFLFLLILGITISCKKDLKVNSIRNYPYKFKKDSVIELKLWKHNNLDDLIDNIEMNNCKNISSKITFKDSLITKQLFLFNLCKKHDLGIPCIKEKNIISFNKDSIIKNNRKYPIDDFYKIFKDDYLNFGKIPYLSVHPDRYGIFINIKNSNIETLKKQLIIITRAYDSLKVDYSLNIELRKFIERPPLPPPPTQKNNEL